MCGVKIQTDKDGDTKMSATTSVNSKNRVCQGEIFYIMPEGEMPDENTFYGGRPAVIVSNDMINEYNGVVSVVYLTTHPAELLPTYVPINKTTRNSWAICDQITTVSKRRIGKFVAQCSSHEMENIQKAIALAITSDIANFSRKNAESLLKLWSEAIANSATTDEISEYPLEDFETPDKEAKPTDKPADEIELKPDTAVSVPSAVTPAPTNMDAYAACIKMQAERDTYKEMYEQLLTRILSAK